MATIAIIETGGKQYLVEKDSVLTIEKLPETSDRNVIFDKVFFIDDGTGAKVGAPYVSGAKVTGEIVAEGKAKKISVIRYRQKSRYLKKKGHRQPFTKVKIVSIT